MFVVFYHLNAYRRWGRASVVWNTDIWLDMLISRRYVNIKTPSQLSASEWQLHLEFPIVKQIGWRKRVWQRSITSLCAVIFTSSWLKWHCWKKGCLWTILNPIPSFRKCWLVDERALMDWYFILSLTLMSPVPIWCCYFKLCKLPMPVPSSDKKLLLWVVFGCPCSQKHLEHHCLVSHRSWYEQHMHLLCKKNWKILVLSNIFLFKTQLCA